MSKKDYRLESDGQMRVPKNALYAAQTARAIKNFPISDLKFNIYYNFVKSNIILNHKYIMLN